MHPATSMLVTALYAAAEGAPDASGSGGNGGTIAVAVIGAVSTIAGLCLPELFRMLRRGAAAEAATPPAVVTPQALEVLRAELTGLVEARVAPVAERARSTGHEVRRLREAMEARDEQLRDRIEKVRDDLRDHRLTEHRAPLPADPGPALPAPRLPEPA